MNDRRRVSDLSAGRDAWRSILELVGWGGNRPPHFPAVARELEMTPKQFWSLIQLEPGEEKPMRALGESISCDASYTTDLVDRLEARGLLERRSSSSDRRVKLIALTAAGERCRERALELLYAPPAEFDRLGDEELATLARLLAEVTAATESPAA